MSDAPLPLLQNCYALEAQPDWRSIEFISDLHLVESQPATSSRFAAYMSSTDADAVFILGDLFEVWIGDDALAVDAFARRVCDVLTDAASRCAVGFMAGNRDFLIGQEFMRHCGLVALPDPTALDAWGRRVLLTHGDVLCVGDVAYQAFRAQVRSAAWRQQFLAQPLAERTRIARSMRDASEAAKRARAPTDWSDVDTAAAVSWLHAAGCGDMVHGHTHRPGSETLAPGFARHVLSDWDLDAEPVRAQVLRLTRDGFVRRNLAP
jgi:UDP-2,3-diacylglucosamine hydrolase